MKIKLLSVALITVQFCVNSSFADLLDDEYSQCIKSYVSGLQSNNPYVGNQTIFSLAKQDEPLIASVLDIINIENPDLVQRILEYINNPERVAEINEIMKLSAVYYLFNGYDVSLS